MQQNLFKKSFATSLLTHWQVLTSEVCSFCPFLQLAAILYLRCVPLQRCLGQQKETCSCPWSIHNLDAPVRAPQGSHHSAMAQDTVSATWGQVAQGGLGENLHLKRQRDQKGSQDCHKEATQPLMLWEISLQTL